MSTLTNDKKDNGASTDNAGVSPNKNPITRVFKEVSHAATEVKKKTVATVSKGTSNISHAATEVKNKTIASVSKGTSNISNAIQSKSYKKKPSFDESSHSIPKVNDVISKKYPTDVMPLSSVHQNIHSVIHKRERHNLDDLIHHKQKHFARSMPVEPVTIKNNDIHLLTDDAMVVVITATIVALYPTLMNWHTIIHNNIPFVVLISWLGVAFAIGYAIGISLGKDEPLPGATSVANVSAVVGRSFRFVKSSDISVLQSSLIEGDTTKLKKNSVSSLKQGNKLEQETPRSWTNLSKNHGPRWKQSLWETDVDPTLDRKRPNLFNHLMNFKLKKTSRRQMLERVSLIRDISTLIVQDEKTTSTTAIPVGKDIGKFTTEETTTTSFDGDLIDPVCILRGMDVFLTDDPETEIGSHQWLIDNGLRDVPTLILNFYTQWGNMLFYFQLPNFVQDWNLVEYDNDPDDVKAMKVSCGICSM
jgi:hypothetical protein